MKNAIRASMLVLLSACLCIDRVTAQPLVILAAATKALKEGADALKSIAETFDKAITTGDRLFPVSDAKRAQARLIKIKGDATALLSTQRPLVRDLDGYIKLAELSKRESNGNHRDSPPQDVVDSWRIITGRLRSLLGNVQALLKDVQAESGKGNAFVATDTFDELLNTLSTRAGVLGRLTALAPPYSDEELKELGETRDAYGSLIARLYQANQALGKYILKAEESNVPTSKPGEEKK